MTIVAPAAPPVQALVAGQALGRFTLLSDLTVRTDAPVWRARDRQLQRDVALKLPPSGAGDALGSAWMTEAQVVARLAHPNLVPLFEATVLEGRQVLVFELVPGMTLAQWLVDKGPMPARDAVALMVGVVDALRAAHEQGVVHRSLTPSCVLVDERGRGRVTDFGMAAVLGQHGAAIGS